MVLPRKLNILKENWRLSFTDDQGTSHVLPVDLPTTVFEALLEHKIIEDPFYGTREHEVVWVFENDYEYSCTFPLDEQWLAYPRLILRLNGVDTIAEASLNGAKLGQMNNMFRVYEFEIRDYVKSGENLLTIQFKSPTKEANRLAKKQRRKLRNFNGLDNIAYLRKAQYAFGWDWGPELPDIGLWRSVEIIGMDSVRLKSVYPKQRFTYNQDPKTIADPRDYENLAVDHVDLSVEIDFETSLDLNSTKDLLLKIRLSCPDEDPIEAILPLTGSPMIYEFHLENPKLWWTHDLGTPHLYDLTVQILADELVLDELSQEIGLRDLHLIRDKDRWGETFYFQLNGIPVFAKGANWIPVDNFIPRGEKLGLYEGNLLAAKEANMNMIRVWGGGIYEIDLFYEFCDRMGILVWQDFPFACSIYPYHEEFVENVRIEAIQNILRIRHHPSLALWCGNNEVEQGFIGYIGLSTIFWPWTIRKYRKGYIEMFEKLLPALIESHDPETPYWPSSPSNGGMQMKSGVFKSNDPDQGDSHFWKVWHQGAPFSAYRDFDSRFMSEYGFESFPSMGTIAEFCPEDQWSMYSEIMENHQKNRAGNAKIMKYMEKRFEIPDEFEKQVILSQITHGEAMVYGIEHWRRNRPEFHCMGSLYWQLNDCWPVASWASLDYFLRWKALHYLAKRAYLPFTISIKESTDAFEIWAMNDAKTSQNGELYWCLFTNTGKILRKNTQSIEIAPCHAIEVEKLALDSILKQESCSVENLAIYFALSSEENALITAGFQFFDVPKKFDIQDPHISWTLKESSHHLPEIPRLENQTHGTTYTLQINSKIPALYCLIQSTTYDLWLSDNYFPLMPNGPREITMTVIVDAKDSPPSLEEIQASLKIISLYDLLN